MLKCPCTICKLVSIGVYHIDFVVHVPVRKSNKSIFLHSEIEVRADSQVHQVTKLSLSNY